MRQVLHWCFRWSWVPCLVLLVVIGHWQFESVRHFRDLGVFRDLGPFRVRLGSHAREGLQNAWRRWTADPSPRGVLRRFDILTEGDALARLDADLPYSGRIDVPAQLSAGGSVMPIELRYRGDSLPHWGHAKKSFRIRPAAGVRFEGMSSFNLLAPKYPEQLNNYLSYWLAHRLGLLAPRAEWVLVSVNGRAPGVHLLVEQPGRDLLRAAGRHPGVLCIGELIGRDAWSGVTNDLFAEPGLWESRPLGETAAAEADDALRRLVAAIQEPASPASLSRLTALLDLDRFAALSVFEQITQSHHADHSHNWRLHWDARSRSFEPMVWDPVGWQESMRPPAGSGIDLHPIFTPLAARLHAHAGFRRLRDRHLRRFLDEGGADALRRELDSVIGRLAAPLARDPDLRPADWPAVAAAQLEFSRFVHRVIQELDHAFTIGTGTLTWRPCAAPEQPLTVLVAGNSTVDQIRLGFRRAVRPTRVRLRQVITAGPGQLIDLTRNCSTTGDSVLIDVGLPPALTVQLDWNAERHALRNRRTIAIPTAYEISLEGVDMTDLIEVAGTPGDTPFRPDHDLRAGACPDAIFFPEQED